MGISNNTMAQQNQSPKDNNEYGELHTAVGYSETDVWNLYDSYGARGGYIETDESETDSLYDSFIRYTPSENFTVTPPNSPNHFHTKQQQVRLPNICQNEQVTPSKKMKKNATKSELQLVLQHFEEAKNKNIEQILV